MEKKDLDFILKVLQEIPADPIDVDWYAVMGYLELNRVTVSFYNSAVRLGIELPPRVKRKCVNMLAYQKARNTVMSEWAERISAELCKQGVQHAFLKGSILANYKFQMFDPKLQAIKYYPMTAEHGRLYSDGERTSNDIDILINQKNITKLHQILTALGFEQGYWDFNKNCFCALSRAEILSRRMNRGETAPYILQLDNNFLNFIEIDINFSLDHLPGGNDCSGGDAVENFLSDVKKYDEKLYGLEETKFFVHLLLHQYKESTVYSMVRRGKDTELYKYLDIYLFLRKGLVHFGNLVKIARGLNLEAECFCVIHTAMEIFDKLKYDKAFIFLMMAAPQDFKRKLEVADPENEGKRYYWLKPLRERMTTLNGSQFLYDCPTCPRPTPEAIINASREGGDGND